MTQSHHRASFWLRKRAAALNVLANFKATDEQRHRARCRLNHAVDVLHRLRDVPAMKTELESDRLARKARARLSPAG
jgi:hypothetical protein